MTPWRRRLAIGAVLGIALVVAACAPGPNPSGSPVAVSSAPPATGWSGRILTAWNGGVQLYTPGNRQPQTVYEPTGTQFAQAATFDPAGGYLVAMTIIGTGGQAGASTVGDIQKFAPGQARGTTFVAHERSGEILLSPTWSGDRLLTAASYPIIQNGRYIDQGNEIVSFDAAGGDRRQLAVNGVEPSGTRAGAPIAFTALDPKSYEQSIALLDPASGQRRTLVGPEAGFNYLRVPALSPDGRRLVFSAAGVADGIKPGQGALAPPPAGSLLQTLLGVLSPRVALAHGIPQDVWLMTLADGRLERLTEQYYDDPTITWSPDGSQLALIYPGGVQRLDPATRQLTTISDRGGWGSIAWAP